MELKGAWGGPSSIRLKLCQAALGTVARDPKNFTVGTVAHSVGDQKTSLSLFFQLINASTFINIHLPPSSTLITLDRGALRFFLLHTGRLLLSKTSDCRKSRHLSSCLTVVVAMALPETVVATEDILMGKFYLNFQSVSWKHRHYRLGGRCMNKSRLYGAFHNVKC